MDILYISVNFQSMNKEEIMDGNKVMAEYLGYKYYPLNEPYGRDKVVGWIKPRCSPMNPEFKMCRSHRDLPFYNDWNALMRVIDKIESDGVVVSITKNSITIHNWFTSMSSEKGFNDKLKATWRVCLKYIKQKTNEHNRPD